MTWVYAGDLPQVKLSKRERREIESYWRQKLVRMSGSLPHRTGAMRVAENPPKAKFAKRPFYALLG